MSHQKQRNKELQANVNKVHINVESLMNNFRFVSIVTHSYPNFSLLLLILLLIHSKIVIVSNRPFICDITKKHQNILTL